MKSKKLVRILYVKNDEVYFDKELSKKSAVTIIEEAKRCERENLDALLFMDLSYDDFSHDQAIGHLREICRAIDIPVYAGGNIQRVEDVKKYLYAGTKLVFLDGAKDSNILMTKEVCDRFGKDKIGMLVDAGMTSAIEAATASQVSVLLTKEKELLSNELPVLLCSDSMDYDFLGEEHAFGLTGLCMCHEQLDAVQIKEQCQQKGIPVASLNSAIPFSEFKLNSDGMIPVIVQDYKTDEVLMLAYMNEEAYSLTLKTGLMTYYSRSRQEIWVKGLTSGHFQYVVSLDIDCDNDTLLAHVKQVGAACHTGNRSCFYRNLAAKEAVSGMNPLKVFTDVMNVILDRKEHPKEGSYTNYLFDKGIDKILKKCGEEATEIVIAAKNPDPEEIKYEISDFLYHVMVLMAVKDVTWEDIIKELANR